MVGLLQPLIALVQILLLSRDRISNHFDHRFEDEAGKDDGDSYRNRNKNDRQRDDSFFLVFDNNDNQRLITSIVIITCTGAHTVAPDYHRLGSNYHSSDVRLFLMVSFIRLNRW